MSWIEQLGQPLAASQAEAEDYMSRELRQALPSGWELSPRGGAELTWSLQKPGDSASAPQEEYGVRLTADLKLVLFTYGNSDAGILRLEQCLQPALMIEAAALHHYGVKEILRLLIAQYPPNRFGYS